MEIRTTDNAAAAPASSGAHPPSRGAYLRRPAAHRLQRRRAGGRRWARILKTAAGLAVPAACLALLAGGYRCLSSSERLALRRVACEGCRRVAAADLEAIVRREFPANILRIDLRRLRARLLRERWIREVEIRRILPGTLLFYVEERRPAAIAELGEELVLTDGEGVLLDKYGPGYGSLDVPVFSGLLGRNAAEYAGQQEQNSLRVRLGLRVLSELESGSPAYARAVSEIDVSDPSNVRIMLVDDTAEVYLGDRDFLRRFRTFMANRAQYEELKAENRDIASVDLRFDGKIIYHQRTAAPPAEESAPPRRP